MTYHFSDRTKPIKTILNIFDWIKDKFEESWKMRNCWKMHYSQIPAAGPFGQRTTIRIIMLTNSGSFQFVPKPNKVDTFAGSLQRRIRNTAWQAWPTKKNCPFIKRNFRNPHVIITTHLHTINKVKPPAFLRDN